VARTLDLSWIRLIVLPVVVVAALLVAAVWLLDLLPPKTLSFAAGREGGAYYAMAERYRRVLARDGIEMTIIESAGSVENAAALAEGRADAGFLQGGVNPPDDAPVEALAATFLEPLWLMHDGALAIPADPANWEGLSVAAGEPGGGTRFVVEAVIRALSLEPGSNTLLPIGGAAAAEALIAGEVDAALFVAPVDAPYLQPLFADEGITASSIRDAEALVRRLPFVKRADIPPAGFDYAERNPPRRIELIAMVGRLVARSDLHPSLVDRLINAAREVNGGRDLITAEGEFPSTDGVAMPLNAQAANMLSGPPSPLYRFLPYWMVAQINSFALLLVPILVLLFPLLRAVPGLYQWRMRSRVYRHYLELRDIDTEALSATDPATLDGLERRLDRIEADLVSTRLPVRFREYAYTMRVHIDLVRRKLAERRTARSAARVP
jgi:TRAP-type uncharacterized transport system substrate-binding protein